MSEINRRTALNYYASSLAIVSLPKLDFKDCNKPCSKTIQYEDGKPYSESIYNCNRDILSLAWANTKSITHYYHNYNEDNLLIETKRDNQPFLRYTYNERKQLLIKQFVKHSLFSIHTYDNNDLLIRKDYANGYVDIFTYDAQNNLVLKNTNQEFYYFDISNKRLTGSRHICLDHYKYENGLKVKESNGMYFHDFFYENKKLIRQECKRLNDNKFEQLKTFTYQHFVL